MDWLDYQYAPTLRGAIGAGFGYTDVKVGADMTYEQVQGRISWHPGRKLTLVFNGGFEDRQFLKSEQSSQFNPIFQLNLQYQIFDQTFISLVAEQTVEASYFAGQTSEVTGFDVGFRQRLLGKLFLDLNAGYHTTDYHSTETGGSTSADRSDSLVSITGRLTFMFLKHGRASLFYDWSRNTSSDEGSFGYTSNQVGVELGYRL